MTEVRKRSGPALGERLSSLDERVCALQECLGREAARLVQAQGEMTATQVDLSRSMAEQSREHAVLAQWMKDFAAEVNAWRTGVDGRIEAAELTQERVEQEAANARGALRVAVWVFGTAITLITGVLSGLSVRLLGSLMGGTAP